MAVQVVGKSVIEQQPGKRGEREGQQGRSFPPAQPIKKSGLFDVSVSGLWSVSVVWCVCTSISVSPALRLRAGTAQNGAQKI